MTPSGHSLMSLAVARLFGGGADDELPGRGPLGSRLQDAVNSGVVTIIKRVAIEQIVPDGDIVRVIGTSRDEPLSLDVHANVNATGFRPDLGMLREVRLDTDEIVEAPRRPAPLIDPKEHSCG